MNSILPHETMAPPSLAADKLSWALAYARMGWKVFPIDPVTKFPKMKGWQDSATTDPEVLGGWFKSSAFGIGIATGRSSGIVVIDIDIKLGKDGEEGLAYLEAQYGRLPNTLTALTPSGGRHLFFAYPRGVDGRIKSPTGLGQKGFGRGTDVDVRADGTQVNAAPTERNGNTYRWTTPFSDTPIADLPSAWVELLVGGEKGHRAPRAGASIKEGNRNQRLASYLGGCRAQGADEAKLVVLGLAWNEETCDPPLDDIEVVRTARSIASYPAGENLTELGNARRFVAKFADVVRYTEGGWYVWDEERWSRDERGHGVQHLMSSVADDVREMANVASSDSAAKSLRAWANKSESFSTIANALKLAPLDISIRGSVSDFDSDPYLFVVEGAAIDLRTGEARVPIRSDFFTNVAPVRHEPQATAPTWERFVDRIFGGDAVLIGAVQNMAGYFLTGLNVEHRLWIAYGEGRNGKGVFFNILRRVLGHYGRTARRDTFVAKASTTIPNDLAGLRGGRLCICDEFPVGAKPDEELLKQISGGDPLTARFLYGEDFTYRPTFKVMIVTNKRLKWTTGSFALKERLIEIPFDVHIPEGERNVHLEEELWEERSGILNWMLEGARRYFAEGLLLPDRIRAATASALHEADSVRPFIEESLVASPGKHIMAGDLHTRYRAWCLAVGFKPIDLREFKAYLVREFGMVQERKNSGHVWVGWEFAT